jgi:hypothetical protein
LTKPHDCQCLTDCDERAKIYETGNEAGDQSGNERLTTTATDDEVSLLGAVQWGGVNPPGVALEMARSSAVIVKPKNRGLLSSVTLSQGYPMLKPANLSMISLCLSLNEPLDITGTKPNTSPGEFHFVQLTTAGHRVNGLDFEAEHCGDLFRFEHLSFLLLFDHDATIEHCFLFVASIAENEEE